MTNLREHPSNGTILQRLWWVVSVCVVAVGLLTAGATAVQAQVQIDQVADVTSQIEGATQGQVVV